MATFTFILTALGMVGGLLFMADPLQIFTANNSNLIIGIGVFIISYLVLQFVIAAIIDDENRIAHIIFSLISGIGLTFILLSVASFGGLFEVGVATFVLLAVGLVLSLSAPFGGRNPIEAGMIKLYKHIVHLVDTK